MLKGCKRDPEDTRDLPAFGAILKDEEPDTSSDLWHPSFTLRDQGATNRCVGFTVARVLRIGYLYHVKKDIGDFSPNDIYFKSRLEHGEEGVDGGTFIRTAFKGIQKYGASPESVRRSRPDEIDMDSNLSSGTLDALINSEMNRPTSWKEQRAAHKYRGLRRYARINSEGDALLKEVRLALSNKMAVAGGWGVPRSFFRYSAGVYDPTDSPEGALGHAMSIVGHNADGSFKIEVNYGDSFGVGGFLIASEDFVASAFSLWIGDVRK